MAAPSGGARGLPGIPQCCCEPGQPQTGHNENPFSEERSNKDEITLNHPSAATNLSQRKSQTGGDECFQKKTFPTDLTSSLAQIPATGPREGMQHFSLPEYHFAKHQSILSGGESQTLKRFGGPGISQSLVTGKVRQTWCRWRDAPRTPALPACLTRSQG